MRRLLLSAIMSVLATLIVTGMATAQAAPHFVLGFQYLASQIPSIVGTPLDNEQYDPTSGDSIQHTTTGLMVWRKADNVTAFTNGAMTWLIGPFGLQIRANDARFGWEKADMTPSLPASAVSLSFVSSSGVWVGQGTIQNPMNVPMDAEINAVGYASPGGTPLIDAPTVYSLGLAPDSSRSVVVAVPFSGSVGTWSVSLASRPSAVRSSFSMDVGTIKNLSVDPMLVGAVNALRTVDNGDWLVRVAAEHNVQVTRAGTAQGVLGDFDPTTRTVTLSTNLDSTSAWVRAAVLSHELQHAADNASGMVPSTPMQCYREEATAFRRQATVWTALWKNSLPPNVDDMHTEMNDITNTIAQDPQAFAAQLVQRYHSECGGVPQPLQAIP